MEGYFTKPSTPKKSPTLRQKVVVFGQHPIFWGVVGLIVGCIGSDIPRSFLFTVSAVFMSLQTFQADFFEGKRAWFRWVINIGISLCWCFAMFLLWRKFPKPASPPRPPTVDEIVAGVQKVNGNPKPLVSTSTPSPANPKPQRHSVPAAGGRTSEPPSSGEPAPPQSPQPESPGPAPSYAALLVSQTQQTSTRADAPYRIRVVIQTTTQQFPSLKLLLACNRPMVEAHGGISGGQMMMMTGEGIVPNDARLWTLYYASATPPFGAANPIIVDVYAAGPISCKEARTY